MKRSGRPQHGYSLIEIMMVMVITVVTAGIAIPTMANTIANMKLRGAASSLAGLLQQARLTAVQKNTTYTARFGLTTGQGAYTDLDGNALAATRRSRNERGLRDVVRHRQRHAAKHLDPLGDRVHEISLLGRMLVV